MAKKKKGKKKGKGSLIRKAIYGAGAIEAAAEGITAAGAEYDLAAGFKAGADALIGNYTGMKPIASADAGTLQFEPWRLAIGYGPPIILKVVERHFGRIQFPF